jgi:hypothetical protein
LGRLYDRHLPLFSVFFRFNMETSKRAGKATAAAECGGEAKRLKTFESVDFSAILQRSHSLDEGQIERMAASSKVAPKFKIINDRYEKVSMDQ